MSTFRQFNMRVINLMLY